MDDRDVRQYSDIIGLPYQKSKMRAHMPLRERAAQFSPFAALTGFDAEIEEAGRTTEEERTLSDEERALLDRKLRELKECIEDTVSARFTWFVPDKKKLGGAYETREGIVKKIDDFGRQIVLADGTKIPIEKISMIESNQFAGLNMEDA